MDNEKNGKGLNEQISLFLNAGFLLSPDVLDSNILNSELLNKFEKNPSIILINKDLNEFFSEKNNLNFNWIELEKSRALFELRKNKEVYLNFLAYLKNQNFDSKKEVIPKVLMSNIKLLNPFTELTRKIKVQDFVGLFNVRYRHIEKLLINRRELQNINSISRLKKKTEKEEVALIGMVTEKNITKNKHIMLKIEDSTGVINVLINKNKPELMSITRDICLDEVIGVTGQSGNNIVFANNLLLPEVLAYKELKRAPRECYALFLSDLHIGSTDFLADEFKKFLSWIRGELGDDKQKALASKIEYIFIIGDLVDGVGVYPGQEEELTIKDITDQYNQCAKYLSQIPQKIKLIIIPGNHDAVRIAEPQQPLYKDLASALWELPNVKMFGNPAYVNILSSEEFPGFDFLLYHGYSFIYYADNVESIRQKGGVDRADLIMKHLLQMRHLAPTHTSNLYIAHPKLDNLSISKTPDFFVTGHLHKSVVANYKNITLIAGSCWQAKTSFMEKMGIHPEPARVPIVNLQTREVKIMRFSK